MTDNTDCNPAKGWVLFDGECPREMGNQTYQRVHVEGTHNVVNAAKPAGIKKIVLLSFLRPTELGLGLPRVEMGGRRNRPVLGPRLHRA